MNLGTRKVLDRSFTALGIGSIVVMALALLVVITPIIYNGLGAVFFNGTIEHRKLLYNEFHRGDGAELEREIAEVAVYRDQAYRMLADFELELEGMDPEMAREYRMQYGPVKTALRTLLGPPPGDDSAILTRFRYGQTRWEKAEEKLHALLYESKWDYSDPDVMAKEYFVRRAESFEGTKLAPMFGFVEKNAEKMLLPRFTVYWGFLTDSSIDAHIFGGIWPEIQGTFFLAIGAMLFAFPLGVVAAVYFTEYAKDGVFTSMLRSANSTLAGVPSIVFGLFGLAFFINTLNVSESKSVLAGALTLAIMILPTIIRAAEEAILSVPKT
jgi:phosphate transport system permease protein